MLYILFMFHGLLGASSPVAPNHPATGTHVVGVTNHQPIRYPVKGTCVTVAGHTYCSGGLNVTPHA